MRISDWSSDVCSSDLHHVADDARRLAVRPGPVVAADLHGVEDATMHRLEAVSDVRQRARHDHAHRVIEVGASHLVFDRDRGDVVLIRCDVGQPMDSGAGRSEEHTSELQSLMCISYAVFCLKKKTYRPHNTISE